MAKIKLSTQEYFDNAYEVVKKELGTENKFALPSIDKVVINTGVGKFEKSQREEIADLMEKLTGQVPKKVLSRQSIAGFKMRAGELNGIMTTLRGEKAKDFVFGLIYLALPRTKDFQGINPDAWNADMSSYSLGVANAAVFPQIGFNTKVTFGMQVNIGFSQGSEDNKKLLDALKFPFKK